MTISNNGFLGAFADLKSVMGPEGVKGEIKVTPEATEGEAKLIKKMFPKQNNK